MTNLTVSWKAVPGAASYVVTVRSAGNPRSVKTYKSSTVPSNQASIAKSALPVSVSGYKIQVQTKAKNGQLSAYSTVPKNSKPTNKPAVVVKNGDNEAAKKAAKVINDCTKEGIYGGAGVAGALIVASFIPGVNVTAGGILAAAAVGGGGTAFTCVLKKIDPLG